MINGAKKYDPYDILQTTEIEYYFPYRKLDGVRIGAYHPEFFIPSEDRVVEVKSDYTLCGNRSIWVEFKRKRQSVLDAGNKFSLLLMTKKGKRIPVPEYLLDKSFSAIRKYVSQARELSKILRNLHAQHP